MTTPVEALLAAEWTAHCEDLVTGLRSIPGFESRGFVKRLNVAERKAPSPPVYLVLRHQSGNTYGLPCRTTPDSPAWFEPCPDLQPMRVELVAVEVFAGDYRPMTAT